MKIIILALSALMLASCSMNGSANYDIVEVESVKDQALKDVQATSTKFFINAADNSPSWERAKLFYIQYLKAPSLLSVEVKPSASQTILTNKNLANQKFLYQVGKQPMGGGYNYVVSCLPRSALVTREAAEMNAKNLARFIKEGTLEISFLTQ